MKTVSMHFKNQMHFMSEMDDSYMIVLFKASYLIFFL